MTAYRGSCDVLRQFELHRLSANQHLSKYFECLERPQDTDSLAGLNTKAIPSQTYTDLKVRDNARLAKTSQACAIRDLDILDKILGEIKQKQCSLLKCLSPGIAAWSVGCLVVACMLQEHVLSAICKFGGFGGALVLIVRLVQRYLQMRKVDPFQHKVRGLIRAFKNGTIRHRELDDILISSWGSG